MLRELLVHSIIPTSGALMGYLAVARIPYELWVKFVWKLIAAWLVIAALVLVVGAIWECQPDGWRRDPGDN